MIKTRQRVTRDITGPTPHSVGLRAKLPSKRPVDFRILETQAKELIRQNQLELEYYNKKCDVKAGWERTTETKNKAAQIKGRVNVLMKAHACSIDERRRKLRDLLAKEQEEYFAEAASKQDTVLERQAKMRARAKELKQKRETERMEIVNQKYQQQWLENCEELRSTTAKRKQDLVELERLHQIKIKGDIEAGNKIQDMQFDAMWKADADMKARREEQETKRQINANKEMLNILKQQMNALSLKNDVENKLKEEESKLSAEQLQLYEMEKQTAAQEKRQQQLKARSGYEKSIQIKAAKEAKEAQEELAFDLACLEQLYNQAQDEDAMNIENKLRLQKECQSYREHLKEMQKAEARQEEEFERLCEEEINKEWQRRITTWKAQKEARKSLLQEVLNYRKLQIKDKMKKNNKALQEAALEKEEMENIIEKNKHFETEQQEMIRERKKKYGHELQCQMLHEDFIRLENEEEEQRLNEKQMEAEREYRTKVNIALSSDEIDKIHPLRMNIYGHSTRVN